MVNQLSMLDSRPVKAVCLKVDARQQPLWDRDSGVTIGVQPIAPRRRCRQHENKERCSRDFDPVWVISAYRRAKSKGFSFRNFNDSQATNT
jgi:hypothetical protein